jgi:Flp pilus assembly protein TadD
MSSKMNVAAYASTHVQINPEQGFPIRRTGLAWLLVAGLGCASTSPLPATEPSKTVLTGVICPTRDPAAMRAYDAGNDAVKQRDIARAEALYREAVQRDPGYCDAMDNLGLLLRRQGKVDEAMEWYHKSLAIQPKNPVARTNLAMALRVRGRLDDSLRELEILLEQDPDDAEAHYGLGLTYLTKNDPSKALEHIERAEKLYWVQRPELTADATLLKGIAQWRLGDCRAATTTLEAIENAKGDEPELNYVLGVCSLDGHREELARGVPEGTLWLELARKHLRRARSEGRTIDPKLVQALRL